MPTTEFLITSFIVVLLPGTGVIFTISTGLFQGWRASVFAALGCTAGIVPHLAASILGLAAVIHMSAVAFQVIKFIGVAYLLYLAWSMWKETGAMTFDKEQKTLNTWAISVKAFLINILNPKLSLFFLAFLPQFVPAQSTMPMAHMLLLSGVFMLMTLVVFIAYGVFAHGVRSYVIGSPRVMKYIQRTFAAVFAVLGAKLAMAER